MKKTKQVEVTVCDVCGVEVDAFTLGYCRLCDKRPCVSCAACITIFGETGENTDEFCRTHIDPEILKKLEIDNIVQ